MTPSSIPEFMTAIEIVCPGGPEVLAAAKRPVPSPGPGEVLVRVEAAGVNRPDLMQREGRYPPPQGVSDIPGLEISGSVAAVGSGEIKWKRGQPLCALVAGGGYAEYCVVPASQCLPIPSSLNMISSASIPETFFTVWANVFERGCLKAGEVLLVHGGSSGIGTTAIQLASVFGAQVITTAGSERKCTACRRLGADVAINYRTEDFVDVVSAITKGRGVDLVLDIVGGSYTRRNIESLAVEGRLVQIAVLEGAKVDLNFIPIIQKRLTVTGSSLRPRSVMEKGALARALLVNVWPWIEKGLVKPVIDSVYPLEQAASAHQRMESSEHIGKIVLEVVG